MKERSTCLKKLVGDCETEMARYLEKREREGMRVRVRKAATNKIICT